MMQFDDTITLRSGTTAESLSARERDQAVYVTRFDPVEDEDRQPWLSVSVHYNGSKPRDINVQDESYWREVDEFPVQIGDTTIFMSLVELRKLRHALKGF